MNYLLGFIVSRCYNPSIGKVKKELVLMYLAQKEIERPVIPLIMLVTRKRVFMPLTMLLTLKKKRDKKD